MAQDNQINNIVIVGGGTSGWISAALLSQVLGKNLNITLVESDQIATIGVGEATIPPLMRLNKILDLDESNFVSSTQGSFKLGIDFVNWKRIGERYMHTFGKVGVDSKFCDFPSLWRRSLAEGRSSDFWDYSFHYQVARQNKFTKLPKNLKSILGKLPYAYHFDASLYAKLLKTYSEDRGVKRIEGIIEDVNKTKEGFISSVRLENNQEIKGDFFIDCSGIRSLLLGKALNVEFEDWGEWLPCDSALAVQTKNIHAPPPYTVSTALPCGWQWRIPLQHRTGNGLVYSSCYWDVEEATKVLLENVEGEPINEPRLIKFRTGMRKEQWKNNCVGIGLAGGFIEPLESTSIHFIQRAVLKLINKFPRNGIKQAEINRFNRELHDEYYNVRDFIILHYHLNERDEEFWVKCREMDIPETLKEKIDIFHECGKNFADSEMLFSPSSWYQVMVGQGLMPKDYHPFADTFTEEQMENRLLRIKSAIELQVSKMSSHAEFIQKFCPARPPE